jgi:hypothetical protein
MGEMSDYYNDGAELAELLQHYDEETKPKLKDPHYWRSKNGRITRIELMDDRHLLNTINMLGRQGIQNALPLLKEKNKLLRETQLRMMGFGSTLTLRRYKNMIEEYEKRKAKEQEEELAQIKKNDRSDAGDG